MPRCKYRHADAIRTPFQAFSRCKDSQTYAYRMNIIVRNIPNFITCLNVASGCAAILCATHAGEAWGGLEYYQWAYLFIALAAVADFCDGLSARALGAYSPLGKELDSLCDLVSFGVAPAVLVYQCAAAGGADAWLGWCAILIPVAGALRLARFNIDDRQTTTFIGLPIPANAIFWIGFTAMGFDSASGLPGGEWVWLAIIVLESWMMLAPVPMVSLKLKNFSIRQNWSRYLLVAVAIVCVVWLGLPGLAWLIVYYVASSVIAACVEAKR